MANTPTRERREAPLHDLCKRIRDLCNEVDAWGFRLEVVADGRVRADFFDGSGYSLTGEARGDVHPEVDSHLDLEWMVRKARARKSKQPGPCHRCYIAGRASCVCQPEAP